MPASTWRALLALALPTTACMGQDFSVTVNPTCTCYDSTYLSDLFADEDTYALTWDERWRDGLSELLSLRAFTWNYDEESAVWESPTIGADAYRDPADGNQAYCEVWSGTWLGAPFHDWADDVRSTRVGVTDLSFAYCDQHLRTWIASEDVEVYSLRQVLAYPRRSRPGRGPVPPRLPRRGRQPHPHPS